ncbi:MAG: AraC family transcriptional regulator [Pseudomonadota bacterium]
MSAALSVYHGSFGRACLYRMNRPMATHAHREGHLAFLVSGADACQTICGTPYEISMEGATAINPWEPHDFRPLDVEGGGIFLVLYIKRDWFLQLNRDATRGLRFGDTQIEMTAVLRRAVQRVANMLFDGESSDLFDGYLYELTRACFEQSWAHRPETGAFGSAGQSFSDFRVRKSIKIMTSNLGSEIVLDEIARESGLSRPHFYKLFRRQTGVTPNLFLNTLRMERALDYLTDSDRSVTDISFDLGFSSQSGFTRFFCANVGMAPSDYRRAAQIL